MVCRVGGVGRINRLKWIIGIVIVLLIIGLASAQKIMDIYEKSQLEPAVELQEALQKMTTIESFRYRLQSEFMVKDRREVISEVTGEKEKGNKHIKGEMVSTPVDIYFIDGTIYNYDSISNKWLVIESGKSNSEDLMISELNPLSNFRFRNVNQVEKIGFEKVGGVECLVVECRPSVESQLLENLWKDFKYVFWIDYKQSLIRKAELNSVNKSNEQTHLEIKVEFSDFNKKIHLGPPDRTAEEVGDRSKKKGS